MTTTTELVNLPRTILGSLTTTFTAPSTCNYLGVGYVGSDLVGWQGQVCDSGSDDGLIDAQACWPATTAGASYPNTPFSGWGFYSPGVVCPAGYSSACTATASGNADWAVQFSLVEGETAVGCCPTGYACTNRVSESGQSCYMLATSTVITTGICSSTDLVAGLMTLPRSTVEKDTVSSTTSLSTSTVESMRAWAPMIQINWKASDLASASATSSSTTTSSGTSSASPSSSSSSSHDSSSISTGAVVGIAIGVVVGALAILAAVFSLWRRKRKERHEREHLLPGGYDSSAKEQWHGYYARDANATELPNPGNPTAFEMQGSGHFAELPAETRIAEAST